MKTTAPPRAVVLIVGGAEVLQMMEAAGLGAIMNLPNVAVLDMTREAAAAGLADTVEALLVPSSTTSPDAC